MRFTKEKKKKKESPVRKEKLEESEFRSTRVDGNICLLSIPLSSQAKALLLASWLLMPNRLLVKWRAWHNRHSSTVNPLPLSLYLSATQYTAKLGLLGILLNSFISHSYSKSGEAFNPTRLLCALVIQSRPTLWDPMDCSPPGSSVLCPFSRQEYWSGLPLLSPRDLLDPGIETRYPLLQVPSEPARKPSCWAYPTCFLFVATSPLEIILDTDVLDLGRFNIFFSFMKIWYFST